MSESGACRTRADGTVELLIPYGHDGVLTRALTRIMRQPWEFVDAANTLSEARQIAREALVAHSRTVRASHSSPPAAVDVAAELRAALTRIEQSLHALSAQVQSTNAAARVAVEEMERTLGAVRVAMLAMKDCTP